MNNIISVKSIIRSKKIDSFVEDYITTNFMYANYNKTEEGKNINEMCIKLAFNSNTNVLALIYGLLLTSDIDSIAYNNLLIGAVALDVLAGDVKGICLKNDDDDVIIDKIIEYHNKNKHTVVFLHGLPGSGKSMIGQLLTKHYNGTYCDELIPWQPGDTIGGLYTEAEPTENNPLIIAFDEIDNILLKIHNNKIESHKNLPIQIKNKETWNKFFDAIDRHKYKHIIIIMTSNRSNEFINNLDSSYLRKGRINLIFELVNEIN
jgi:Cdc6-like AAA superfamily ATPase